MTDGLVELTEAADRLGLSQEAIRKRIHRGTLAGRKVDGRWLVLLPEDRPDIRPDVSGRSDGRQDDGSLTASGHPDDGLADLIQQLHRENLELAGRLGFYQSEIQHLQAQLSAAHERIALLEAPKNSGPDETTNHPTPERN